MWKLKPMPSSLQRSFPNVFPKNRCSFLRHGPSNFPNGQSPSMQLWNCLLVVFFKNTPVTMVSSLQKHPWLKHFATFLGAILVGRWWWLISKVLAQGSSLILKFIVWRRISLAVAIWAKMAWISSSWGIAAMRFAGLCSWRHLQSNLDAIRRLRLSSQTSSQTVVLLPKDLWCVSTAAASFPCAIKLILTSSMSIRRLCAVFAKRNLGLVKLVFLLLPRDPSPSHRIFVFTCSSRH